MAATLLRRLGAACGLAWALAAQAAPFVPRDDATVVQALPATLDAAARRQRAALARQPANLPLALATARAALERARRSGDPRDVGLAQAALAPWWQADAPPPAVRLLRAAIRQSLHDFDRALTDLAPLANDTSLPAALRAQALLTQTAVLQVTGRLPEAGRACAALAEAALAVLGGAVTRPARACAAELASLQGGAGQAARDLATLAREAPADRWIALLQAELAERVGDSATAEAAYSVATAAASGGDRPEVYALAARADWLLARGRAADALAAIQRGEPDADALLLRRAIAQKRLGMAEAETTAAMLATRLAAAAARGERTHLREQARLALDVRGDATRALALARDNWAHQKEPADALLLARAAQAAGDRQVAAALAPWLRDGWTDVRLAQAGVEPPR
jgi:hypothetical protein